MVKTGTKHGDALRWRDTVMVLGKFLIPILFIKNNMTSSFMWFHCDVFLAPLQGFTAKKQEKASPGPHHNRGMIRDKPGLQSNSEEDLVLVRPWFLPHHVLDALLFDFNIWQRK